MHSDKPKFSLLNHTADMGITVLGSDLENLFEGAVYSMMQVMVRGNPSGETNTIKLSVTGEDLNDLMVRWLGEVLYLLQGENELVIGIQIHSISPSHLDATLKTVPFDPHLHEILCEIKAVTYHQIEVTEKNDSWEARIIFDV